jgi:hypothetical protein
MKNSTILTIIFVLSFCFPALSQKQSKVDSLFNIMVPKNLTNQALNAGLMSSIPQDTPQALRDSLFFYTQQLFNNVIESMKSMYLSQYTEVEVDELLRFYNTPLGKKTLNTSFELSTYFFNNRTRLMSELQPKIDNLLKQYNRKEELLPTSTINYFKPKRFVSKEKSSTYPAEIYYDENQWVSIPPHDLNPIAEKCLLHKEKEIYTLLITEPTKLTLSALKQAVIINLRRSTKNLEIINQEIRNVNGKNILTLLISAKMEDTDLVYQWYIYCSDKGCLQYLVFTDKETYNSSKDEFEQILNGLIITE